MALARIFLMVGGRTPGVGGPGRLLSGPGRGPSQPQLFVFARAGLLGPAEQKKEREVGVGVIGRDRSAERSSRPCALQPQARASPGRPFIRSQSRPRAPAPAGCRAVAPRERAQRMRSGARRRPGRQTPAAEWRRARASLDSNCSATELPAPAPARPGSVPFLHPLPDRAALSHRLEMRDPGRGPRSGAAVLGLRSEQGLRCVRRVLGKGSWVRGESGGLHRDPPQPRMPSRPEGPPRGGIGSRCT